MLKKYSTLLILLSLAILLTVLTDGIFISPRNLTNLTRQISLNGILAVGMTLVILISGIDLSVGSVVALAGIVVGISQAHWGLESLGLWGTLGSALLAIAVGVLCGFFNAYWMVKHNITSFITTLGMMVIARGLALIFSGGIAIAPMSPELQVIGNGYIPPVASLMLIGLILISWIYISWGKLIQRPFILSQKTGQISLPSLLASLPATLFTLIGFLSLSYVFFSYRGIPIPVFILALVAYAGYFILSRMTIGRYIFAMGGNLEASRLCGVPMGKVTFFVFIVMGGLAGLSGLILTSRLNGAIPTAGNLFELDAIAAVVIGGTSLMGGVGTIWGSILGAFIIGTLNNGMSLMNVPTFYQMVIKGLIIILAVLFDSRSKQNR